MNSLHVFLAENVAASKHPLIFFICNLLREGSRTTITPQKYGSKLYREEYFQGEREHNTKGANKGLFAVCCFRNVLNILLNISSMWIMHALQCLWEDAKHYIWWMEYMTSWWFPRYCFKWKNEQFHVYRGLFCSLSTWVSQRIAVKGRFLTVFCHWSLLHGIAWRYCILVHWKLFSVG